MSMRITVEQKHIDKAERGLCEFCPVALAMAEVLGGIVTVSSGHFSFKGNRYLLPFLAVEFVEDFDWGQPVEPFSFKIEDIAA